MDHSLHYESDSRYGPDSVDNATPNSTTVGTDDLPNVLSDNVPIIMPLPLAQESNVIECWQKNLIQSRLKTSVCYPGTSSCPKAIFLIQSIRLGHQISPHIDQWYNAHNGIHFEVALANQPSGYLSSQDLHSYSQDATSNMCQAPDGAMRAVVVPLAMVLLGRGTRTTGSRRRTETANGGAAGTRRLGD
ncbi:hypothetical protein GGX14DRAFT_387743 [Mycena pura]|uniref:Uncharacterized protein n=1 Tax=Mycena pura TaxID=153505 RepID=A0AAD6YM27_9AGAR|nr:hypothetical protein GGX14DRAFT_387743 [Mycena pura]